MGEWTSTLESSMGKLTLGRLLHQLFSSAQVKFLRAMDKLTPGWSFFTYQNPGDALWNTYRDAEITTGIMGNYKLMFTAQPMNWLPSFSSMRCRIYQKPAKIAFMKYSMVDYPSFSSFSWRRSLFGINKIGHLRLHIVPCKGLQVQNPHRQQWLNDLCFGPVKKPVNWRSCPELEYSKSPIGCEARTNEWSFPSNRQVDSYLTPWPWSFLSPPFFRT